MIVFGTLTGMDMGIYNGYPSELKSPEQVPLNNTVMAINRANLELNNSMHIKTPLLASEVHKDVEANIDCIQAIQRMSPQP